MIFDSFFSDYPILVPYGCSCLLAHAVLYVLFKYAAPPGPWKQAPSFTAHQAVALVLMVQRTVIGFNNLDAVHSHPVESDSDDDSGNSGGGLYGRYRVLQPVPAGLDMAQRAMGALWIWDIPVTTFSSETAGFDALMHAHHVGMFLVTCVALGLLSFGDGTDGGGHGHGIPVASCYAPAFLGVIELSSVPLQLVDLFHPGKVPAWHSYMEASPALGAVNTAARNSFAVLFLAVRGVYFPYVVTTEVLPGCWAALRGLFPRPICLPVALILAFAVAFTALQLHWAMLVVRQIARALGGGGGGRNREGGAKQHQTTEKGRKDE